MQEGHAQKLAAPAPSATADVATETKNENRASFDPGSSSVDSLAAERNEVTSSSPRASPRKLTTKSRPFWELQQERLEKKKREEAAAAEASAKVAAAQESAAGESAAGEQMVSSDSGRSVQEELKLRMADYQRAKSALETARTACVTGSESELKALDQASADFEEAASMQAAARKAAAREAAAEEAAAGVAEAAQAAQPPLSANRRAKAAVAAAAATSRAEEHARSRILPSNSNEPAALKDQLISELSSFLHQAGGAGGNVRSQLKPSLSPEGDADRKCAAASVTAAVVAAAVEADEADEEGAEDAALQHELQAMRRVLVADAESMRALEMESERHLSPPHRATLPLPEQRSMPLSASPPAAPPPSAARNLDSRLHDASLAAAVTSAIAATSAAPPARFRGFEMTIEVPSHAERRAKRHAERCAERRRERRGRSGPLHAPSSARLDGRRSSGLGWDGWSFTLALSVALTSGGGGSGA